MINTNYINRDEITGTLVKLGSQIQKLIDPAFQTPRDELEEIANKARQKNPWFTNENIFRALREWSEALTMKSINQWLLPYQPALSASHTPKTIGVINAGNIPFVGLHDLICVLVSGNKYLGKNSSDDPFLLSYIAGKIIESEPAYHERISFADKLSGFDAVIATGSNNSARYFDYYFGKYPNIIRMNRNGVAVLTGTETENDFKKLSEDIFLYFGLGCRNVSKLYVPRGYDFRNFFEAIEFNATITQHHKYMNNYEYNRAIYLLKKINFFDNGFLIVKEDVSIPSPIAVVHYEYYDDLKTLDRHLLDEKEKIQCVIGKNYIPFGNAQHPQLWDYADGIDTLDFLLKFKS
jgi:hypothetical protein